METPTEALREHFEKYGEILEAVIISDKVTGRSKAMDLDAESAKKACEDAAPIINGRRANCNLASLGARRPRSTTPAPPQHGSNVGPKSTSPAPANHVQWYYPAGSPLSHIIIISTTIRPFPFMGNPSLTNLHYSSLQFMEINTFLSHDMLLLSCSYTPTYVATDISYNHVSDIFNLRLLLLSEHLAKWFLFGKKKKKSYFWVTDGSTEAELHRRVLHERVFFSGVSRAAHYGCESSDANVPVLSIPSITDYGPTCPYLPTNNSGPPDDSPTIIPKTPSIAPSPVQNSECIKGSVVSVLRQPNESRVEHVKIGTPYVQRKRYLDECRNSIATIHVRF
ncbi:hypothetical protein GH714_037973 [Hevea brasiliensis]|uniref:RRM domain-containing protein n=1 Tax=Hevea brasiliensis TaxID=3981 RepID=A0A6A6L607_HEVBR|nr:hypothetical protein GH714_037973 [Hevea brasiliensis]